MIDNPIIEISPLVLVQCSNCRHLSMYHMKVSGNGLLFDPRNHLSFGVGPCQIGRMPGLGTYKPCECLEFV